MPRVLIDTHALIWWLAGDERLSLSARRQMGRTGGTVLVSAASGWEIATKRRKGKLPDPEGVLDDLRRQIAQQGFEEMPISLEHAERAGALPHPHADPFDRMLAAQAQAEGIAIVSRDEVFELFGVKRIW